MNTVTRNNDILKMKKQGATFQEIGDIYNISRERARQIYYREKHKEIAYRNSNPEFYDALKEANDILHGYYNIPARIMQILDKKGILQIMSETGCSIDNWSDEELICIKGFGPRILSIIRLSSSILSERSKKK